MILNWEEALNKPNRIPFLFISGGWVKRLTFVDQSKGDSSAFVGQPIPDAVSKQKVECPDGLYLVLSWTSAYTVPKAGQTREKVHDIFTAILASIKDNTFTREKVVFGDDWPLKLRDLAAELLDQQSNPLAGFSEEDLAAELAARRKKSSSPVVNGGPKKAIIRRAKGSDR